MRETKALSEAPGLMRSVHLQPVLREVGNPAEHSIAQGVMWTERNQDMS